MESVVALKQSVEKLVDQVGRLREAKRVADAKAVASEARALLAEQKVAQLQEQLTASLLKSSITEVAGGAHAAKLRISRLIRDIDKCIAMCSK